MYIHFSAYYDYCRSPILGALLQLGILQVTKKAIYGQNTSSVRPKREEMKFIIDNQISYFHSSVEEFIPFRY